MDQTLARLESLGLSLPSVPTPVAAYVNCVRSGNLLFLSGGLPIDGETKYLGRIPDQASVDDGVAAARLVVLNRLAVIRDEIGSLDKVRRIVALNGFVNAAPGFAAHPQVVNGASELLLEVFGPERGAHSRTALGVSSLPLDVSVELNLVVEVD